MRDQFLVFGSPQIEQAEIDEVLKVLESGWLGTGSRVARFERDFSHYNKSVHETQLALIQECFSAGGVRWRMCRTNMCALFSIAVMAFLLEFVLE